MRQSEITDTRQSQPLESDITVLRPTYKSPMPEIPKKKQEQPPAKELIPFDLESELKRMYCQGVKD